MHEKQEAPCGIVASLPARHREIARSRDQMKRSLDASHCVCCCLLNLDLRQSECELESKLESATDKRTYSDLCTMKESAAPWRPVSRVDFHSPGGGKFKSGPIAVGGGSMATSAVGVSRQGSFSGPRTVVSIPSSHASRWRYLHTWHARRFEPKKDGRERESSREGEREEDSK